MNRILLVCLFLLISASSAAFAQKKRFVTGYVVNTVGDTVKGKVARYSNLELNHYHCQLIRPGTEKAVTVPLRDILAVHFNKKTLYRVQVYDDPTTEGYSPDDRFKLMERLSEGEVELYMTKGYGAELTHEPGRYSGTDGLGNSDFIPSSIGIKRSDDLKYWFYLLRNGEPVGTKVNMLTFRKQMRKYFADDEEIVKRIQKKRYDSTRSGIVKLVNDYNARNR